MVTKRLDAFRGRSQLDQSKPSNNPGMKIGAQRSARSDRRSGSCLLVIRIFASLSSSAAPNDKTLRHPLQESRCTMAKQGRSSRREPIGSHSCMAASASRRGATAVYLSIRTDGAGCRARFSASADKAPLQPGICKDLLAVVSHIADSLMTRTSALSLALLRSAVDSVRLTPQRALSWRRRFPA